MNSTKSALRCQYGLGLEGFGFEVHLADMDLSKSTG